jgi:PKD repeat protein
VPETLGENPGSNQSPVANCTADPNSGAASLELNFDASNSTDPDGMIVLYEWDFDGDGIFDWSSPDTGDTTYTYTSSGSHNATLRVTDDEGATETATVTIDVNEPGTEISVEEVRVGASADDAEEKASGAMYLNSSDLELVHIGSGDQTIGVRFVQRLSMPMFSSRWMRQARRKLSLPLRRKTPMMLSLLPLPNGTYPTEPQQLQR